MTGEAFDVYTEKISFNPRGELIATIVLRKGERLRLSNAVEVRDDGSIKAMPAPQPRAPNVC